MTGKLLAHHLKNPRVPLVVRVPQFENHWASAYQNQIKILAWKAHATCTH